MPEIKKYTYELETISDLVLSPRAQNCFYKDSHFSAELISDFHLKGNVKIIYPFYQYGLYERYQPNTAQYYIPGSSIKGAIGDNTFTVDDIMIKRREDMRLKNLFKMQNVFADSKGENQAAPKIDSFFPGVAVEMLGAGSKYTGAIFSQNAPHASLNAAQKETKRKLEQLTEAITAILNSFKQAKDQTNPSSDVDSKNVVGENSKMRSTGEVLSNMLMNIRNLQKEPGPDNCYLLLLGGYKGIRLSSVVRNEEKVGGIYVDMERELPHGLVWVKFI